MLQLGGTISSSGNAYTIDFYPSLNGSGSATVNEVGAAGYINPKYVIVGVTYAPPGPQSYVNYQNSALVSNTSQISQTFGQGYTFSVNVKSSGGVSGWFNGSVSGTSSTGYTQTSNDSSSVTVSKTTSLSDRTPGPVNPYVTADHDYDTIWLWLNPLVLLTVNADSQGAVTNVQWNGYGFNTADQPELDVYPVYVGQLNGDLPFNSGDTKVLARSWAANEVWPSGQGPGLTSADFKVIEQADPYWQCTPNPSQCPASPDLTRYTLAQLSTNLVYEQPPPGGQPLTQTYTASYTNASSNTQGSTTVYKQTFGLEESFGGSFFGNGVQATLSQSSTFSWTTQQNTSISSQTGSSATGSVTGPPCNVVANACDPVFFGSSELDVYEDNYYGTFLFYPVN